MKHGLDSIKKYLRTRLNLDNTLADSTNVLLILLTLFGLMRAWCYGRDLAAIDFYQFWAVSQNPSGQDVTNIYSETNRRKVSTEFLQEALGQTGTKLQRIAAKRHEIIQMYSTPFLYSIFRSFVSSNYDFDVHVYTAFSFICFLLAVISLCRLLRYGPAATMAAILVITVWFEPFFSDTRVGNVGRLQMGLVALFLWFQSKYKWRAHNLMGGLVLGFAVMFKPTLAFVAGMLVVSWVINRRYKKLLLECVGILIAGIVAFVYSSVFFGSARCWTDWLAAVRTIPASIIPVEEGNFAVAQLVYEWAGVHISIYLTILFTLLTVIFALLSRQPPEETTGSAQPNQNDHEKMFLEDILMAAVGCLIYLLAGSLVWLHYFVLAIPMVLFTFRPFDCTHPVKTSELLTRRILPAVAIIGLTLTSVVQMFKISAPSHITLTACTGNLILFGLSLWELSHPEKTAGSRTTLYDYSAEDDIKN